MRRNLKCLAILPLTLLLTASGHAAPGDGLRLVEAVRQGDKDAVRSLLKLHVNVNTPQGDGATALFWAAYRDDLETADLLIRAGAKANLANDLGVTPLALACSNGSAVMVDRLLKAGAQPTSSELLKCAQAGNPDAVKSLLARGADPNAKEPRAGQTTLMWAVAARHPEVARLLIERGADVNARSKSGFTPLMFAVQQGDLDSIRILLGAGANLNDADQDGETPLLVASASGNEPAAILLLDKGADAKVTDNDGLTALHYSLMRGLVLFSRIRVPKYPSYLTRPNMLELMKALLVHGADPNARVKRWSDKLITVTGGDPYPGSVSVVSATPFLMAAISYDAEAMRILVAGGANPLLKTEVPSGVVFGKDGFIDPAVKAKLVAAGVIHPAEVGPWNVTALMVAAGVTRWRTAGVTLTEELETRALEAVKLCIELGIDVNAADTLGLTALHGAAFNGSNRIIQYLVEKGANLNAKDISGQTPLDKAMNIKPPGQERGAAWHRSLIPLGIAPKSTAELLIKLGATPSKLADVAQAK